MPDKRKAPSSESNCSPYTKRARPTDPNKDEEESCPPTPLTPATTRPQPKNDPVYGQKHAFPGLDDPVDENQLIYGPAEDGIEYLRMVRSEARTLPTIFVSKAASLTKDNKRAPETSDKGDDNGNAIEVEAKNNQAGFYSDGVYVAYSSHDPQTTTLSPNPSDTSAPDPQEIYYNLLHHRFLLLRSTLKCTPPASVIASLGAERPVSLPRYNKRARAEWERIIQTMDPHMAQLACMDMESVLGLLAIVTRLLSQTVRGGESVQAKRLGAWAWGLLGRCRVVGEMGSEEVGDIRELGKRAARILVKVRESEAAEAKSMREVGFGAEYGEGGEEEIEETEEEKEQEFGGWKNVKGDENGGENGDGNQVDELHITNEAADTYGNIAKPIIALGEASGDIIAPTNGADSQNELEAAKTRLQARLQLQQTKDKVVVRENKIEGGENNHDNDEEEEEEEGEVGDEDEDEAFDENKSRNVQQYTRAMLDMIISVIGEFYGQKDLLEFRDIWEADMDASW